MRAILLGKILKHCATNTDSTDRIARGHKNFLKIKMVNKGKGKDTFIQKILLLFLEHDLTKKVEYILQVLVVNYEVLLNTEYCK